MTIKPASQSEINIIQDIAHRTWPATYSGILSSDQLSYMLEMMYSVKALNRNFDDGVRFLLAEENGHFFGFAGFEHGYGGENRTHIHKIYVLPEAQGRSVGKMLMHAMEQQSLENGSRSITLNVNRKNEARHFYARLGFEIVQTIDIEIGNGYLMEDFVMQKLL